MKKFENITVLHVDDFDYTNPEKQPHNKMIMKAFVWSRTHLR